jgi:hypothetical protein
MINQFCNIVGFVFVFTFLHACKSSSESSDTKTNVDAADALGYGFESLDPGAKTAICETNAMIVFVGNAEKMGTYKYGEHLGFEGDEHKMKVNEGYIQFHKTILDGAGELKEALRKNRCDSYFDTKVTLLSIVDGPKKNDSAIEVTKFAYINKKWEATNEGSINYSYTKDTLEALKKPTEFELNLPKSISTIIEKIDTEHGKHDQIIYFFKSHGGIVSTAKGSAPDLLTVYKEGSDYGSKKKHVFLFDSHDENGEIKSGIYSYFWTKSRACKLFKAENMTEAATNAHCDDKKGKAAAASSKQGGEGSATQGGEGSATQGSDGSATQGSDGSATQGSDGSATQGSDGSATQGSDGSATQGGDGSATQGGDGSATQGGDGSATQGFDGSATQGPGKGLMYLADMIPVPKLSEGEADKAKPDLILHVGAAATYDMAEENTNKDIYKISLPVGGKPDKPTLITLDSCYGSDQVAKSTKFEKSSAEVLQKSGKKKASALVCTLSNPKPTYTHTVNYSLLDAGTYLALSQAVLWQQMPAKMPDSADQIGQMTVNLHNAFMNPSGETSEAVRKKYETNKIDVEALKEEYLQMKPVCMEIE